MMLDAKTVIKSALSGRTFTAGVAVVAMLALFAPKTSAQEEPTTEGFGGRTWAEWKAELREGIPAQYRDLKTRVQRLRIVRRPKTVLESYPEDEKLWETVTAFYDYIKGRELDVYYEQPGIPEFFPDRGSYYDFLDTILPPMRERRFERNRILEYRVHEITPDPEDPDRVTLLMSVESDDIFPFGKLMIYKQHWIRSYTGWYPGKVEAELATYWERVR